jgi:hypothetical protein
MNKSITNLKNVLSVGLAAATLVLFLAVTAGGGALRTGLAPWPGIGAIVLATAAFLVSCKQRSYLVAGLLAASGVTGIIAGMINTEYFAVIMFPGPILGVIIGVVIIGLGVAKGIATVRIGSKTATMESSTL